MDKYFKTQIEKSDIIIESHDSDIIEYLKPIVKAKKEYVKNYHIPIGYMRFQTLPKGKEYKDDDKEMTNILHKQIFPFADWLSNKCEYLYFGFEDDTNDPTDNMKGSWGFDIRVPFTKLNQELFK